MRNTVEILGVPVDVLTKSEAVDLLKGYLKSNQSRVIFTPNPEIIWKAQRNSALFEALRVSDINVADGIGVVWASRLLGYELPERVSGSDLVECLLELGDTIHISVYLLGSKPEIVRLAAARLEKMYPGVRVAGYSDGFFPEAMNAKVVQMVNDARPNLLLVGMGSPRQEVWLAQNRHKLHVPVMISVGGYIDVIAGKVPRAPMWVRRLNAEWIYRIVIQPKRLVRVPALAGFVISILWYNLCRNYG